MSLQLGDTAPSFTLDSTDGSIHFHDGIDEHWAMFCSRRRGSTPLCAMQIGALARRKAEFDARDTLLIGRSVDSVGEQPGWAKDIADAGGSPVNFPILADPELDVATVDGVVHPKAEAKVSIGALFVLNFQKKARLVLPCPPGGRRNVNEMLRVIDSRLHTDGRKLAAPAAWKQRGRDHRAIDFRCRRPADLPGWLKSGETLSAPLGGTQAVSHRAALSRPRRPSRSAPA